MHVQASRPIKVLFVEDSAIHYQEAQRLLAGVPGRDFHVQWLRDPETAWTAIVQQEHDVYIIDHSLPGVSGLALLGRAAEAGLDGPFILLVDEPDRQIDEEAIGAGAADYLVKERIDRDILERSIRHAIDQHETLKAVRYANWFYQSTLDALTVHIAVLNAKGVIIAVNEAWRRFAEANEGKAVSVGVGADYAAVCENAIGPCAEEAPAAAQAIRDVLSGARDLGSMEYPCHSPSEERWFMMRVTRFEGAGGVFAVVGHENITKRKLGELEVERSHAAMAELAVRDELTGLYNRRRMWEAVDGEIARSERYGRSCALLMLDIDHFKAVNDTHGHQTGDEVLKWVAGLLKDEARAADWVFRYGGEEMALLLPETDERGAAGMAERVRARIANLPFEPGGGDADAVSLAITVSIGLAVFPGNAKDRDGLLKAADEALYHAKAHGRNRAAAFGALAQGGAR